MREEKIGEFSYRIGKMSAKTQWNVVRRLGPVFAAAGPALTAWAGTAVPEGETEKTLNLDEIFSAFGPLAVAMGDLSDESSDYVISHCLAVCMVNRSGTTWAAVATPRGDLMFADMSMALMLRLSLLVLQENLSDFLAELRGVSPGPA